jgi:hypothetical protein
MRQEAETTLKNNRSDGIAIITVNVVCTANGEPLLWVVANGKRVEPSGQAAEIIRQLVV